MQKIACLSPDIKDYFLGDTSITCIDTFVPSQCILRLGSKKFAQEQTNLSKNLAYNLELSRDIEERILKYLVPFFNQYNNTKFSHIAWKLICGHSLKRCINFTIARNNVILNILNTHEPVCFANYKPNYNYLHSITTEESLTKTICQTFVSTVDHIIVNEHHLPFRLINTPPSINNQAVLSSKRIRYSTPAIILILKKI